MKLEEEKSSVIKQFKRINDPDLVNTIKGMVDYGLKKQEEQDVYNIPESDKKLVRRRIKATKNEDLIPWTKAEKKFKL